MLSFDSNLEISEIVKDTLFALHWNDSEANCLDEMVEELSDSKKLFDYFNKNKDKLTYYNISIENAIIKTMQEANSLYEKMNSIAVNAQKGDYPDLDDLFEPLHKNDFYKHPGYYTDFKIKGQHDTAPWIRIYAIKIESNVYVMTGFGIKLVERMQEDSLLKLELKKLTMAAEYLQSIGLLDD